MLRVPAWGIALLVAPGGWAAGAAATPVSAQFVRYPPDFYGGVTFDGITGHVFEIPGFGPGWTPSRPDTPVTEYASAALFESGTPLRTFTLSPDTWGTYIAAHDGNLYGRTSAAPAGGYPVDTNVSRFSTTTGSEITTVSPPGEGGVNGPDSLDWGGFTAVNVLSDGARLYVVGHTDGAPPGDWTINTYDFALTFLHGAHFVLPFGQPGYAFAIDGAVFFGEDYNRGSISARVDALTGAMTAVSFVLAPDVSNYMIDIAYDSIHDTLYWNSTGAYYKVSDASGVFMSATVPEPDGFALVALALAGMTVVRRRLTG